MNEMFLFSYVIRQTITSSLFSRTNVFHDLLVIYLPAMEEEHVANYGMF
jgi:hypothetical protein